MTILRCYVEISSMIPTALSASWLEISFIKGKRPSNNSRNCSARQYSNYAVPISSKIFLRIFIFASASSDVRMVIKLGTKYR